jgi:hypothetical protein
VSSPKPSIASMFPSDFNTSLDSVHAPMQSIFGSNENGLKPGAVRTPSLQSPPTVRSPIGHSMGLLNQPLVTREPYFPATTLSLTNKSKDVTDSLPIPVKIVPSPNSSHGLKSPSVLQHVNNNNNNINGSGAGSNNTTPINKPANPFQFPIVSKPVATSDEHHSPMPNLFDSLGRVKDADNDITGMRQRFEEAKQRMALSLPAREGGLRPNSLLARSMFDDGKFNNSWSDDGSFLLDQLRRRHKRRMETPSAPHPELTPQQKQHISERTATAAAIPPGSQLLTGGMPARRGMHPGGSVAERVLLFEKSPSVIGMEPGQTRIVPIRREPTCSGTALTPWRSQQHYDQHQNASSGLKSERIVPISRLEAAPLVQPAPPPVLLAPPQPAFARQRQQASTTFRPPSLHLPGKEEIPRFYFPSGNPAGKPGFEATTKKFNEAFAKHKTGANLEQLGQILKVGLCFYCSSQDI